MLTTPRRNGRPPKRAVDDKPSLVSVRLAAETKNLIIDMADGYGISIADYITLLVRRDAQP